MSGNKLHTLATEYENEKAKQGRIWLNCPKRGCLGLEYSLSDFILKSV